MKRHLYQAIAERIAEQVPGVQWLDRYNSQPDRRSEQYAYPLPAVFVQFAQLNWQSVGEDAQTAEVTVTLHVEQETYGDTYYLNFAQRGLRPSRQLNTALQRDELLEQLQAALEGYAGDCFTRLTRISEQPDDRYGTTTVDLVSYQTILEATDPQYHLQPDGLGLDGSLEL